MQNQANWIQYLSVRKMSSQSVPKAQNAWRPSLFSQMIVFYLSFNTLNHTI